MAKMLALLSLVALALSVRAHARTLNNPQGNVLEQRYLHDVAPPVACKSVKDYGAAGDGIKDDTMAVQAGLTALSNEGCLEFPLGTYVISNYLSVSNVSGVSIAMYGNVKPTGKLNNVNNALFLFSAVKNLDFTPRVINQSYTSTLNVIRLNNCHFVRIHGGKIDVKYNSFDGTAAINLGALTTDVMIDYNFITSGYGVLSNNVAGNARITIDSNTFEGQKRYGSTGTGDAVEINDPTSGASQVSVVNNHFFSYQATLKNSRLMVVGFANVTAFKVSGNEFVDSEGEAIHIEYGSNHGEISGNLVRQGIHGINLISNGASVTDVAITNNQVYPGAMAAIFSAVSADYGCGILVNVGTHGFVSRNITIVGNEVKGAASSSKGICIYDLDGGTVKGNQVSDMGLAGIDIRKQNGAGVGPRNVLVTDNVVRNSGLNFVIGGVTGGPGSLTGGAGPLVSVTFDRNQSYGGTLKFDSEISQRTNTSVRIPRANAALSKLSRGDILYP